MLEKPDQNKPVKRPFPLGLRLTIIGFLIIWGSSIAFALQLKTLLTTKYPAGSDPSFDIIVAAIYFILFLFGILFLWRGVREIQGLPGGMLSKYITIAGAVNLGLLVLAVVSAGLVFSANRAFAIQNVPILRDEPAPDFSMAAFPTPALPQPTPTYDPANIYMDGSILSYFTNNRVGTIWISVSRTDNAINYIEVYTNRIECRVQQGQAITTYAIDKSIQLINGPIQVQGGNFFASQDMAVVQGIMNDTSSAYGTVYLHYNDPATQRSCDLGSFTWTATATGP